MLIVHTSPAFLAEKHYACTVLLGELLGITWEIRTQPGTEHYRLELPNGAVLTVEDHFWGKLSGETYLNAANVPETATQMPHPYESGGSMTAVYGRPLFAASAREITCGLDLFASAFFMLTRWEEFVRPERDGFGRFPAASALAMRAGFLDRPVVQEYAELLRQALIRLGYSMPGNTRKTRLHLSHDVDHPRLWWRPTDRLRTLGGSLIQRKSIRETAWWLRNHVFYPQDPFDIFEFWMDFSEKKGLVSHFNFMGERNGTTDCPYSLKHPFVKKLIHRIAERGHVVGFHPSREAHLDATVFSAELESLRQACPDPVTTGRQHYLCFSPPDTWQRWADAGMVWDSTLGYPEAEGFRCGMCCDFPVFNFLAREILPLREKPLIAMDVTLAQYRRYTPEQALERLSHLRRQVDKYGGEFVLLWHNSSWNTFFWKEWRRVYETFLED